MLFSFPEYTISKTKLEKQPHPPGMPTSAINREIIELSDGRAIVRNIIFEHPTKEFILIQFEYSPKMKFNKVLEYLELEDEFIKTLGKKNDLLDVVLKYNLWKEKK